MNLITYIIMITAAVASFFLYTNPHYKSVQGLKAQAAQYEDALDKAKEAEQIKVDLAAKRESFSQEDVELLHKMLPDTVDNIRLLLDINQIAAGYGSGIAGIHVDSGSSNQQANPTQDQKADLGAVTIGFNVTMSYTSFLAFLKDLEQSLRITDLTVLNFSSTDTGQYSFGVSLKTYWLQ